MAEETALEMRQAGQPVRGFKSLHLRSYYNFFSNIFYNNCIISLTIVAFICIIATVKEILQVGFDRGLVKWYDRGLQNLWWEFDSLIPCS